MTTNWSAGFCARNHDLSNPDNVYQYATRRTCKPCNLEREAVKRAARKGIPVEWKSPHDWYDWVVVERMFRGFKPGRRPTRAEKIELVRRAERTGVSTYELARRCGVDTSRIDGWRREAGLVVSA